MFVFLVFNVLNVHLGTVEDIIPVYGLLISVLKEAWNYAIFSPLDKELFNQWRQMLSDNLNRYVFFYNILREIRKKKQIRNIILNLKNKI